MHSPLAMQEMDHKVRKDDTQAKLGCLPFSVQLSGLYRIFVKTPHYLVLRFVSSELSFNPRLIGQINSVKIYAWLAGSKCEPQTADTGQCWPQHYSPQLSHRKSQVD